jgi:hypothetical protein
MNQPTSIDQQPSWSPQTQIDQIVDDLNKEERQPHRFPFCRPVSIRINCDSYMACSRDISITGIGLIHNVKLMPGPAEISISQGARVPVTVPIRIVWCASLGQGWFISGGEFIGTNGVVGYRA